MRLFNKGTFKKTFKFIDIQWKQFSQKKSLHVLIPALIVSDEEKSTDIQC